MADVQRHSVHTLVFRSLKRTHDMFLLNQGILPPVDPALQQIKKSIKAKDCYGPVLEQVKQHNALMAKNHQENKADPPPPGDETFGVNAGAVVISHIQNTMYIFDKSQS